MNWCHFTTELFVPFNLCFFSVSNQYNSWIQSKCNLVLCWYIVGCSSSLCGCCGLFNRSSSFYTFWQTAVSHILIPTITYINIYLCCLPLIRTTDNSTRNFSQCCCFECFHGNQPTNGLWLSLKLRKRFSNQSFVGHFTAVLPSPTWAAHLIKSDAQELRWWKPQAK